MHVFSRFNFFVDTLKSEMSSTYLLLTHCELEHLSWSCKALNSKLAIHFHASVTFLLPILEIS